VTDTRYLVHGVFWDGPPAPGTGHDGGAPVLRLQSPSGDFSQLSLHAGARLGFHVVEPFRLCLGHLRVHSSNGRGSTKVGTASGPRKWNRLAEQGAVAARYVARAQDGRVVRILEDLVTAESGLTPRSAGCCPGLPSKVSP
jgi:hypothetical protein